MAGYVKIWTNIRSDEKFLSLTANQRSIYLQLLLACKDQSDDGHVRFKNYSHAAQWFGGDDSTVTRGLLKLHSIKLISMERDVHNVITIELPNYQYWQQLTVKDFHKQNTKRSKKISQKSPTRPDQTRPKQTRPLLSESNPDHKEAVEYWCSKYLDRFKIKYDFRGGKDGDAVKRLLATFGLEVFCRLVDQIFLSDDPFYRTGGGLTLTVLKANANKLAQEIVREDSVLERFSEKGRKTVINIAKVLQARKKQDAIDQ